MGSASGSSRPILGVSWHWPCRTWGELLAPFLRSYPCSRPATKTWSCKLNSMVGVWSLVSKRILTGVRWHILLFLTSCAFLSVKPRKTFVLWSSFSSLSYQQWAVCTQWLTLFHYLLHLSQCPPTHHCPVSFLVCQHIFIIAQSRYVGTQRVKNI